jgi:glyoxylase-like metal-dependent hydrolase (beta-lactamase superfamily II)
MLKIHVLPYGIFAACAYLVQTDDSCCLIDPAVPPSRLPPDITSIRWLFATHGHIDHISQADNLRRHFQAPLLIHPGDADCLVDAQRNYSAHLGITSVYAPAEQLLADGQSFQLAADCELEILHTPGHSAGCVCLLLRENGNPRAIFSGDTLFAGSIGRLDLGGSVAAMRRSLQKIRMLGQQDGWADVPVYPGHGPTTTLRDELRSNPYFQSQPNGG